MNIRIIGYCLPLLTRRVHTLRFTDAGPVFLGNAVSVVECTPVVRERSAFAEPVVERREQLLNPQPVVVQLLECACQFAQLGEGCVGIHYAVLGIAHTPNILLNQEGETPIASLS